MGPFSSDMGKANDVPVHLPKQSTKGELPVQPMSLAVEEFCWCGAVETYGIISVQGSGESSTEVKVL